MEQRHPITASQLADALGRWEDDASCEAMFTADHATRHREAADWLIAAIVGRPLYGSPLGEVAA